jgi:hypothetical protein
MATHGDRKVIKAITLTHVDEGIISWMFAEYLKLVDEHPEVKACVSVLSVPSSLLLSFFSFSLPGCLHRHGITDAMRRQIHYPCRAARLQEDRRGAVRRDVVREPRAVLQYQLHAALEGPRAGQHGLSPSTLNMAPTVLTNIGFFVMHHSSAHGREPPRRTPAPKRCARLGQTLQAHAAYVLLSSPSFSLLQCHAR